MTGMTKDEPHLLWAVRTKDHHTVECRVRLVPTGVDVEITSDGNVLYDRIFATSEDALAWTEQEKERLERSERDTGE